MARQPACFACRGEPRARGGGRWARSGTRAPGLISAGPSQAAFLACAHEGRLGVGAEQRSEAGQNRGTKGTGLEPWTSDAPSGLCGRRDS